MKDIPPTGENLVTVCLVSDIPDQLVNGCIEHIMQSYGQFDYTKTGTQMPFLLGNDINDKVA